MSSTYEEGDVLPPLRHTATPLQLFRYSAVTWNPHRIHFDERYAREEGHDRIALHSHLRRRSPCAVSQRAWDRSGSSQRSPTDCESPSMRRPILPTQPGLPRSTTSA